MNIIEDENKKIVKSLYYNYIFDKNNGFFARWGATKDEDPEFSPFGPEIADIEISSANIHDIENRDPSMIITDGACKGACPECYKSNHGKHTVHMSLDTYKKVMDRLEKTVTCQVALGITTIDAHPQLFDILWETRNRGIIPNITIVPVGVTDEHCRKLSEVCGAVAVSIHKWNKDKGYDVIKKLSQDYGMAQINIHIVLAEDTIPFIEEVVEDMKSDNRLSSMNALVMLSFKDKAKTGCYTPISQNSYNKLVSFIEEKGVRFGFDSCSSSLYLNSIKNKKNEAELAKYVEPCESTGFSIFCDVFGNVHPCSFSTQTKCWNHNMNILDYKSILDVWYSENFKKFRKNLLANGRNCPIYQISLS